MRITGLFIHPVKSCAVISLQEVLVDPLGFAHDREYMLVDADGQFLSQRSDPKMALIIPRLEPAGLRLSAPGRSVYHHETVLDGENWRAKLILDNITVMDQGDGVAQWFSDYLETPCRLVRALRDFTRTLPGQFGGRLERNSQRFFDLAPLLVVNQASLDDLNQVLDIPVPMARFRPNIILDGGKTGAEQDWRKLQIGELSLTYLGACERCKLPNVNPETGSADQEIYRALRDHLPRLEDRYSSGVPFGAYMGVSDSGTLRLGDTAEV